ncbi:ATP-binding protein [Nonomuraea sp. NPDC026600]|uniref:ATP-binding protein n=1 Tax=Nonomuraea sp. NPDC026600 TaxID=3155363 RepID=UPI003405EAAC
MKSFNTTGPCRPGKHFMLPPIPRIPEARELIDEEKYFVIRGPRQSGKTTSLQALAAELRNEGEYAAVYISCESASTRADQAAPAEVRILSEIAAMARATGLPEDCLPPDPWPEAPGSTRLLRGLSAWARRCPRPIVLLVDEIDSIHGDELISVLRQLRQGYNSFPVPFPHSVALCGMRDVRAYETASSGDSSRLVGPSPFNILAESMRLADFTFEQVAELYGQHTDATGQEFTAHAIQRAFHASQGQPWLVNALAREIIRKMRIPESQSITDEHMNQAVERLIVARAVHLDSLAAKLREDRVQRIIEPLLTGEVRENVYDDDLAYARDLGLVTQKPPVQVANPIYQEVIVRVLSQDVEADILLDRSAFLTPDGRLDMPAVLQGFLTFWRRNGEILQSRETYHEAACHLIFMAWLHRVVNGGGVIDREYALGRGRMDICVQWPYTDADGKRGWQWEAIELKVHHPRQPDPVEDGLHQLDGYLDHLDLSHGILIVFDRRPTAPHLLERTAIEQVTSPRGHAVTLVRA